MPGVQTLVWCAACVAAASATYRHLSLSAPDICLPSGALAAITPALIRPETRTVELEEGTAAILTIQANNGKVPFSKCDLKIKSSSGDGLLVRVETGVLRRSTHGKGKCIDYLQLGRDDSTPFFTWDKTEKLCGRFSRYSYTVSNGELLVWLRLGEWDNLDTQESVHLSLVVTQFKTQAGRGSLQKYRACHSGEQWISREYFCDGRVNCAQDLQPADEDPAVCRDWALHAGLPTTSTTLPSGPPLNLLSITLILVSAVVILFLFCLLIVKLRHRSCRPRASHSQSAVSCELPDAAVVPVPGVAAAPGQPQPPHIYLDLSTRALLRGSTPEAEPPPAYNDLFPPGYKYLLKAEEEAVDGIAAVAESTSDQNAKESSSAVLLLQGGVSQDSNNGTVRRDNLKAESNN